jgi:uncharacterized metal-binding protein YceD (DUF177 family)
MVVDLSLLQRDGPGPHALKIDVPRAWMAEQLADTDAEVLGEGRARLDFTFHSAAGAEVLVRGSVAIDLAVPCARCLEPARVVSRAEICLNFKPEGANRAPSKRTGDDDEEEVDLAAPEEATYTGHHLDLRPVLAEQVVMAYPLRALCARGEACRGLCSACGADLNDLSAAGCAICRPAGPATVSPPPQSVVIPVNQAWKAALAAIRRPDGDDE